VITTLRLNPDGTVSSILAVTGPDLLRDAASVLKDWIFEIPSKEATDIKVTFRFSLTQPETKWDSGTRIIGTAPNLVEIVANFVSEKPGPNIR
jgi:hypothetical protein